MNFQDARNYVIQSYGLGKKRGRADILAVLREMNNPQEGLRVIHVAGTNGKGSCCAMLDSVLREAGYSSGFFSSPHLNSFNERFRINGELISDVEFSEQVEKARQATEHALGSGECLSYFELLTVMAFNWFYEKRVDYAIIETGIGGRQDSTNVVIAPVMSVICSIALDHTELLGDTIELIAEEKAGIIKNNCPVVLYCQGESVYNIVKSKADELGSRLYYDRNIQFFVESEDADGICFSIKTESIEYKDVCLSVTGVFQLNNAALVLLALKCFQDIEGINLSEEIVLRGMKKAGWAGRLERILHRPGFFVDGAHNAAAALALNRSIGKYFKGKSITIIVGILRDKAYNTMMKLLCEHADRIIITKPHYDHRAASVLDLRETIDGGGKQIFTEDECERAVDLALSLSKDDDVIICCGSLYLVGDVREYLLRRHGND